MKLKELFKGIEIERFSGRNGIEIRGLKSDSKKVMPGDLFIALRGSKFDGHDFVEEAVERGAACLVVEEDYSSRGALRLPYNYNYNQQKVLVASIVRVQDTKKILSQLCKNFYSKSIEAVKLIGVTGTNGKTTTTYLLESIFKKTKRECGVIGTVNYRFLDRVIPPTNTTPGILDTYNLLDQMKKNYVDYCILEASSHSLAQGRIDGLLFEAGIFTNLTAEHLDYHRTIEDYLKAKLRLFDKIKEKGNAIVNIDDPYSKVVINKIVERGLHLLTYGIKFRAEAKAEKIYQTLKGIEFTIDFSGEKFKISSPLIGLHNVYNILAAFSCATALGFGFSEIIEGIEKLSIVPGRLERINLGQDFLIFVDYAHTEDSLKNAILSLKNFCKRRLLVVFGCGGERDRTKRPLMGKLASILADKVFVTSDNPRGEDPKEIVFEIISGIPSNKKNYEVIIDREEAIKQAISEANPGDILLVAGKGHESIQVFKDRIIPFDDREVVRRFLERRYTQM